jgi:hypothetical protein
MSRLNTAKMLVLSSCFLFLLSLAACSTTRAGVGVSEGPEPKAKGGPPPHAPAHGYRAKHTYRYYPDSQVYFDVSRRVYFYIGGDEWRVSASLPSHLHGSLGSSYVTFESDSDKPYTEFESHKQKHPPGKAKK